MRTLINDYQVGIISEVIQKTPFKGANQVAYYGVELVFHDAVKASIWRPDATIPNSFVKGDVLSYKLLRKKKENKSGEEYETVSIASYEKLIPSGVRKYKQSILFLDQAVRQSAQIASELSLSSADFKSKSIVDQESIFKDYSNMVLAWMVSAFENTDMGGKYELPLKDVDPFTDNIVNQIK